MEEHSTVMNQRNSQEIALDIGGSKICMEKKKCSMVIVFMQCDKINLKGRKKGRFSTKYHNYISLEKKQLKIYV